MKKIWLYLLLAVLAGVLLTGCAGNADTQPSPTPGASANPGILNPVQSTAAPEASAAPSGIRTVEDARKAAEEMEDAIERLSEVDEADVALAGDTALVGLKLTGQYQGQVDDRLKKMVLARVQTVEKSITKVAVTDNAALRSAIDALDEAAKGMSALQDMNDKAEEILKQLTVYSE